MLNFLKQTVRIFTQKDFTENPKAPQISDTAFRALLIGLINSEQITAYTNSLTTGLPKDRLQQGLTEAWDIHDEDSAYETIEYLQRGGHRVPFQAVLPFIDIQDEDERNEQLWEMLKNNAEKILFYAKVDDDIREVANEAFGQMVIFVRNLKACMKTRVHDPFCPFNAKNMEKGILAWDLGRLITITRMCYDFGYIDEKVAWDIILDAYEAAKQEFSDWKEVAVSYLIGRGAWAGDSGMLNGLYSIAELSFEDKSSPWTYITFK